MTVSEERVGLEQPLLAPPALPVPTLPIPSQVGELDVRALAEELAALPVATRTPTRTARVPGAAGLLVLVDAFVAVGFIAAGHHRPEFLIFTVLAGAMLHRVGLYRQRLTLSLLDDLPGTALAILSAVGLTLVGWSTFGNMTTYVHRFAVAAAELAGLLLVARAVAYAMIRYARRSGQVSHPTLVLGCGQVGAQLALTMLNHPECGLRPVGFLDDEPLLDTLDRPVPLLGRLDELGAVIRSHDIQDVVVAFLNRRELAVVDTLRTCDRLGVEIFMVPRLFEVHSTERDADILHGLPLLRLRRPTFRSVSWRVKRVLDVVMAGSALVLASPLLGACALAVWLEGGRGVLFRQERVGLDGRHFMLLKFRSLKPVDDSESATLWNVSHDKRMGSVGRILRKLSLDELPQLWNILRGDMSVVGPRPERPFFVQQFAARHREYPYRHRVPSGLTGWAQVNGLRGDTSIAERARFDNYYIENWSLWLDVKIVLRTVAQVFRAAGG